MHSIELTSFKDYSFINWIWSDWVSTVSLSLLFSMFFSIDIFSNSWIHVLKLWIYSSQSSQTLFIFSSRSSLSNFCAFNISIFAFLISVSALLYAWSLSYSTSSRWNSNVHNCSSNMFFPDWTWCSRERITLRKLSFLLTFADLIAWLEVPWFTLQALELSTNALLMVKNLITQFQILIMDCQKLA